MSKRMIGVDLAHDTDDLLIVVIDAETLHQSARMPAPRHDATVRVCRCNTCGGYWNAHVRRIDGEYTFRCPVCGPTVGWPIGG